MRDFRKLHVWHKAHAFTLETYMVSAGFPRDERFGLTTQLRRAAVSIGANLAEGCGRESDRELLRHVAIASGSASECECVLQIAADLHYLEPAAADALICQARELRRMLAGYRKHFERLLTPDP